MSEYIPTKDDIRDQYASSYYVNDAREFDRWLEAHDREVAARAWDEGFIAGDEASTGHLTDNPYKENNG